MYFFLSSSPSIARGAAQLIFDFLILSFLKGITDKKSMVGYFLIMISTIFLASLAILCYILDCLQSSIGINITIYYYQLALEISIQITSIFCFVRTFFISKTVAMYLNSRSYFILKTLGVIYVFLLILYYNFNIFYLDYYIYTYVNAIKPELLKFFENTTVFSFFFLGIIQTLVSALSVYIINLNIMDNLAEKDEEPSPNGELSVSLVDY